MIYKVTTPLKQNKNKENMQLVVLYAKGIALVNALKESLLIYKNDQTLNLRVFCCDSQKQDAQEWVTELQGRFEEISIVPFKIPSPTKDEQMQKFYERLYPRLRTIPNFESETIYLHPTEVPACHLWDGKFRDEFRKAGVNIFGVGEEVLNNSKLLTGSFMFNIEFQKYSKSGRQYYQSSNIFQGIAWEVKNQGQVVDSLPFLQKVSEFNNRDKTEPVEPEPEKPVEEQKKIASTAAAESEMNQLFEQKMRQPPRNSRWKEQTPVEPEKPQEKDEIASIADFIESGEPEDKQEAEKEQTPVEQKPEQESVNPPVKKKAAKKAAKKATRRKSTAAKRKSAAENKENQ